MRMGVYRKERNTDRLTLPSFLTVVSILLLSPQIMVQNNSFIAKTVDCFTRPAAFQLLNADEAVVVRDYERVRELEKSGMWDFSVICPTKPEVRLRETGLPRRDS